MNCNFIKFRRPSASFTRFPMCCSLYFVWIVCWSPRQNLADGDSSTQNPPQNHFVNFCDGNLYFRDDILLWKFWHILSIFTADSCVLTLSKPNPYTKHPTPKGNFCLCCEFRGWMMQIYYFYLLMIWLQFSI